MSVKRIFSSIGVNHVIIKGNNDQPIFLNDNDRKFFLNLLNSKIQDEYIIISYCLMSNHIHLLIKDKTQKDVSNLMDSVLSYYSKIFNERYGRKGALFKQRFFSEGVENDFQFSNTIRYIHDNPLKAGMIKKSENYKWSSYHEYLKNAPVYCNIEYAKKYLGHDEFLKRESRKVFEYEDDSNEYYMKSYDYVAACVEEYLKEKSIYDVLKLQSIEQEKLIKYLQKECNISCNSISKVIGISIKKVYEITRARVGDNSGK